MKNVLVTGACINTGVAIVEKFASEGYNVVFTGRNCESVSEAEKNAEHITRKIRTMMVNKSPVVKPYVSILGPSHSLIIFHNQIRAAPP